MPDPDAFTNRERARADGCQIHTCTCIVHLSLYEYSVAERGDRMIPTEYVRRVGVVYAYNTQRSPF